MEAKTEKEHGQGDGDEENGKRDDSTDDASDGRMQLSRVASGSGSGGVLKAVGAPKDATEVFLAGAHVAPLAHRLEHDAVHAGGKVGKGHVRRAWVSTE